jgi:outer membrane biosynthesis protein TonB
MKPTTGNAPPRRLAKPKKQVRLDLRRRAAKPEPEGDLEIERQNSFWKFVGIVALLHVIAIVIVGWYYEMTPTPPPQDQMISLLPLGDVVKGTAGNQAAPKIGPTTAAPSVQHHAEPPPPAPVPTPVVAKPTPVPTPTPQPIIQSDAPALVPVKPTPPAPPKPKVKVDLTLQDGPTPAPVKHVKPKPHVKKPAPAVTEDTDTPETDSPSNPDSMGLSKEQIAQRLGDKLQSEGATNATNHGVNGSKHSQANQFADFYMSVRDQVMSKWTSPNLSVETAVTPQVTIRVENDGVTVLPESVTLTRSSGNAAYDDSALAAAKQLGHLVQPLPAGCPPVIYIDFTLN